MNDITVFVFAYVFAIVKHSGNAVGADFAASFRSYAFDVKFIGNFTH